MIRTGKGRAFTALQDSSKHGSCFAYSMTAFRFVCFIIRLAGMEQDERPCLLSESVNASAMTLRESVKSFNYDASSALCQYHDLIDKVMCQSFGLASGGNELAFVHLFFACLSHS